MLRRKAKKEETAGDDLSSLPMMDLKLSAYGKDESQGVMLACKQLPGYPTAMGILGMALLARADRVLLDYSANATAVRFRVDGVWENNPPMDRPTGDAALVVLKRFFGMNPNERRAHQSGKMALMSNKVDWVLELNSQGVNAGERVLLTFDTKKPVLKTLEELGMREAMRDEFKPIINGHGVVIISAPAGHGLPTTWRIALDTADKFVRDWVSLEDERAADPEIINVTQHLIKSSSGETPYERLYQMLLKQPDVFVLPKLYDDEVVKTLLDQVTKQGKHVVTKLVANDAVDALIQVLNENRANAKELLMSITGVLNQRLVRRLCDTCRQPFAPSPQLLQKLGIPPGRVNRLFQPYILPPPDKRVDDKGNPIIPCPKCGGRGYLGRMAIFELLKVDDNMRKAVLKYIKQPDAIRQFAKQNGHLGFQEEGILAVVLGTTSLQELQRVLAPAK